MTVPEQLKINRFVDVHIPSNSELFKRLGVFDATQFTGTETAQMPQSKIDCIAAGAEFCIEDMPES